jgi:hypothetical protein
MAQPGRTLNPPSMESAICWVCGKEIAVYRGCRTIPREVRLVNSRTDIEPTTTCGDAECAARELARQDALFNMLMRRDAERRMLTSTQETPPKRTEENVWRS